MAESWITKPKRLLDATAVRRRYRISDPVLWTWLHGGRPDFPEPSYRNGRRQWDEAELDAYDRRTLTHATDGSRPSHQIRQMAALEPGGAAPDPSAGSPRQ